jgi:hypothetical protein
MTKIFTKTTVSDEVLGEDARYNILEDGGTAYKSDMQIVLNSPVSVAGTDINAALLNPLEVAVDTLDDMLVTYTTAGTSTAFTLTTPQASSLATDERWRVKFNATAGATPTLNRDAKGAKSLKYYDGAGVKQSCGATTIISGMITDVVYDGTDYVILNPLHTNPPATTAANDFQVGDGTNWLKKTLAEVVAIFSPYLLPSNGWTPISGTFTYASATTVNVSSGAASIYSPGDVIRFQNNDSGTYLYAYIVIVADTLLTLRGDTVPNATLTDSYYSHSATAVGFPGVFAYTPTGVSASNAALSGRYSIYGRRVRGDMLITFTGGITFTTMPTLPIAASASFLTGGLTQNNPVGTGGYFDNGTGYFSLGLLPTIGVNGGLGVLGIYSQAGANMTATYPITWANGDLIILHFDYEY